MDIVWTILGGLLLLTILVVAHEGGHFLVGRACNIRIEEFAVGFGPKLLSKVKNGIRYSIRALPLGGFVQFYGEDEEVEDEPRAFNNRPIWQRALTIVAGPVMNVLVALIITIGVLTFCGDYVPVVANVQTNSAAEEAGLENGDRILSVNGQEVVFASEVNFLDPIGSELTIEVEKADGSQQSYTMQPRYDSEAQASLYGFAFGQERVRYGFFEAIGLSFHWLFVLFRETLAALGNLIFRGQGLEEMGGPVAIISLMGQAIHSGWEVVLRFGALLSLNLGIMNILPFPALDGGRLVFLGIEKLRGKPLPRDKEGFINFAGLIVLFGLMAVLTYQDIARLISG